MQISLTVEQYDTLVEAMDVAVRTCKIKANTTTGDASMVWHNRMCDTNELMQVIRGQRKDGE